MEANHIIDENSKNYKMTLLYTQTKELHEKFNKKMELSPSYYYLVDKKWLDNYKERYQYKTIIQKLKNENKYNNYENIKAELSEKYKINEIDLTKIDVEKIISNFFSCQTQHLEQYKLEVPINIELVNNQFFEDCLKDSNQIGFIKTNVYIGDQTILIVDDKKNNKNIDVLYCCSLFPSDADNYNFFVKVEYILIFNDTQTTIEEIGNIRDIGGLNKYLIDRNIFINKKEEQIIRNKEGKIIGKFLKFEINDDDNIFSHVISSINDINIQENKNQIKNEQIIKQQNQFQPKNINNNINIGNQN